MNFLIFQLNYTNLLLVSTYQERIQLFTLGGAVEHTFESQKSYGGPGVSPPQEML